MSPELQARIGELFAADATAVAARLERDCGDTLPLISAMGEEGIERVRCAVLKLSEGSPEKLERALRVAREDWRDSLVAAGFGHDPLAHRDWLGRPRP